MKRNYIDGSGNIFNVNIMHPCPHPIYLLKVGFRDAGFDLVGDILSDPDLQDRWVFSGTDYFTMKSQTRLEAKATQMDYYYDEPWNGMINGTVWKMRRRLYDRSFDNLKPGNYKVQGSFRIQSFYGRIICRITTKLEYSLIYVPFRKILEGERENILKSIAYQLIALNKAAEKDLILKYLYAVNYGKMSPPLENSEIETTIAKIYQNLNDVEPIPNAERRFIYDASKNFTPTEKRRLNIKKVHQDRTNKTQSELLEIMKNWDFSLHGKMTIKSVAKVAIKDPKTVQSYYTKLKTELLQDLDEEQVQMGGN
ncbi:hypothetical protein [Chryseobacterium sp. G0201]|uniref:hypothetical protein n=1 Tax=Chryseobacterium sp. G0201 TaxID=2487065 RepID=UPI000F4E8F21|nr:hypothetical protein [Chryseobacterium sp. G0201]AZA55365.1 hypothetical protein EG348_21385 [Chryseobacterium sp. G0201]